MVCFPGWETLPHERLSPRSDTVGQRLAVLRRLAHPDPADEAAGPLSVVVAPVRCLLQPIVGGLGDLEPVRLRAGDTCDPDELLTRLVEIGYAREDLVGKRGDVAVRGGIIDVFSPTDEHPVRIEFFGDTVEEIRYFKVADQRSLARRRPACGPRRAASCCSRRRSGTGPSELAAGSPACPRCWASWPTASRSRAWRRSRRCWPSGMDLLTDYVPAGGVVMACDPERIRTRAEELVSTSREFLDASWVNAAAGGEAPIDLGAAAFQPIAKIREAARARALPWWTIEPFGGERRRRADTDARRHAGRRSRMEATPAAAYRGATDAHDLGHAGLAGRRLAGRAGHRGARSRAAAHRGAPG